MVYMFSCQFLIAVLVLLCEPQYCCKREDKRQRLNITLLRVKVLLQLESDILPAAPGTPGCPGEPGVPCAPGEIKQNII
jgi:hypothetical protein